MFQANFKQSLIAFVLVLFSYNSIADEVDAKTYIANLTTELQQALRAGLDQGLLGDDVYLDTVIDQNILPHVDQEYLSRRVFQPRWDDIVSANKAEAAQAAVVASLRRTYRVALNSYNGQKIEIGNSRDKPDFSVVRVKVHTSNNAHLMDFALRQKEGQWRVFDLSVDGVVFSKTLNGSIRRNLGSDDIDQIISSILPEN